MGPAKVIVRPMTVAKNGQAATLASKTNRRSTYNYRRDVAGKTYRIATNACLDAIGKRPKRVLPVDYGPPRDPHDGPLIPLADSVWVEPYPDEELGLEDGYAAPEARYEQREAVELAFIAALQHLPPNQRAALILREVLGFSAREVAEILDTTTASVNSALQRARKATEERLPERSQQATLRSLGDEGMRGVVQGYVDAWDRGDIQAVVEMLSEDACFSMPPAPSWHRGTKALIGFLGSGRYPATGVGATSWSTPTASPRLPSTAGTRSERRTWPSRSTS